MGKITEFFNNPGARPDMHHRAPMAVPSTGTVGGTTAEASKDLALNGASPKGEGDEVSERSVESSTIQSDMNNVVLTRRGNVETSRGFTGLRRGLSDRCMDFLVDFAGSQIVFFLMWIILTVWCIIGIVYKAPGTWQVVMQDGQSIQCYVWDTLLMRQQLISSHEQFSICGDIRSRISTLKRLFHENLPLENSVKKDPKEDDVCVQVFKDMQSDYVVEKSDIEGQLPSETWYDKFCSFTSVILGSLYSIVIYWIGIFVWVGTGALWIDAGNTAPYTGEKTGSNPRLARFGTNWQLYINSATAVVLLVCSVFLQNIRARHDKYINKFVKGIVTMDNDIEVEARRRFSDFQTPNPVIIMKSKKRRWGQKIIDFYADVVGTGIGIVIAIAVFGTWLGIGHVMSWDDDWWLIIGTYTGLVGYLDGFVIREAYQRITRHEEECYQVVAEEDVELFQEAGIECPPEYTGLDIPNSMSADYKVSEWINRICSSAWSVLFAVCSVIALIIISSTMHWSTLGQLIANTPTMIIEGFFLIVLIQAHNWADQRRRIEISCLYARRCILLAHLQNL